MSLFRRFGSGPCPTRALARRLGSRLGIIVGARDGRRQHGNVQTLVRLFLHGHLARATPTGAGRFRLFIGLRLRLGSGFGSHDGPGRGLGLRFHSFFRHRPFPAAIVAVIPIPATAVVPTFAEIVPAALTVLSPLERRVGAGILAAFLAHLELVAILIEILVMAAVALLLLFLASAIIGQHAEIMIGKLQIIFSVHAIAGELRVACHILVFFKKLGCIAASAAVNPVPVVAPAPISTVGTPVIVPAAITPAGLPVVDQELILAFTLPSFTENTVQSPSSNTACASGRVGLRRTGAARPAHALDCQRRLHSSTVMTLKEQEIGPF